MPLQNRVDPFGAIHAVAARGSFTGNRGVIHDPATKTLLKRRWTTKAWIICDCDFQGCKRDVFGRNSRSGGAGWTNLFFLDEVTALAAGHRPCFFCRREKAREFADCFGKAFGVARPKTAEIDERLHSERLASGGGAIGIITDDIEALPDGAMISDGGVAYAIEQHRALRWTFAGYVDMGPIPRVVWRDPSALTPAVTIATLRTGYRPVWSHRTATGR